MMKDLKFDDAIIGFAAGVFFIGYFLLEIPGSILVEQWSARKVISRIMITWGITAAATAWVKTPTQFYVLRFLLGLCEAGFFPGAIIYMTHWFLNRDRTRALGIFMIATPIAQLISPKISSFLLVIGTDQVVNGKTIHYPEWLGMEGWQWMYIFWGIPAVILGIVVLWALTDHPREARWLNEEEKRALEAELLAEKKRKAPKHRMRLSEAMAHPRVLLLALAYFCTVTANYALEFFQPSIVQDWYKLELKSLTWVLLLPPILALTVTLLMGWNSDRTGERRLHAALPGLIGAIALGMAPMTRGHLWLTIICLMITGAGLKAYLAPFWAIPSLFLTETAAAGCIGLINSIGNLGGFIGPTVAGMVKTWTGSFDGAIYFLAFCMLVFAAIIFTIRTDRPPDEPEPAGFEPIMPAASQKPI